MSRDKRIEEIEEMAKALRTLDALQYNPNYTANYQRAVGLHSLGYRKASEVAREFRQRMNEKMGKHTHLLGKEYVQRIMREIEKEFSEVENG